MNAKLSFEIARDDESPLCEQLKAQISTEIRAGRIRPGERLPSTRRAAAEIGVNRQTVVEAYRRLELEGLVRQRVGSGTYVQDSAEAARSARRRLASRGASELAELEERRELPAAPPDAIDLAAIAPDERDFPWRELGDCVQQALAERGGAVLGYGPVSGDPHLRELLAERLRRRGLEVDASELVIVGGAQQGLDLVLRAVVDSGELVLTETPTYHLGLDLLRFHGLEVATVPLLPGETEGMSCLDPQRLDALLARRPSLVYCMPNYQNPTGLTLDLESRRRLAEGCARAGALLVEDDYEAELAYEGDCLPPLSALPEADEVAYVGTLSKALCPGLRVGWVAGSPALIERLARVKRVSDLSGSPLMQAAAARLIESGAYDGHLAGIVEENRERMRLLTDALARDLPEGCRSTRPLGGHAVWVRLPEGLSARAVAEAAAERGVVVSPGDLFETESSTEEGLRLSLARARRHEIPRGVTALVDAISHVASRQVGAQRHESPVRI